LCVARTLPSAAAALASCFRFPFALGKAGSRWLLRAPAAVRVSQDIGSTLARLILIMLILIMLILIMLV